MSAGRVPAGRLSAGRRPDFFIVGAPKCGTTALAHYLSAHPDIFMARKEMHFFGADLRFGPQFYRRDQKAYLAEFDAKEAGACGGEASVWYLFSQEAATEIKAFNPEARIIIMLREPAAMIYSLYHQFLVDGNEHLPTFAEALEAEDDRRGGRRISRRTYFPQGLLYRDTARYARQVARYFEVFGRARVRVIIYDDFLADTAGTFRQTLDFLGIAPAPADIEFGVINGSQTVRSSALQAFMQDPLVRGTAIALRSRVPRRVFTLMQKLEMRLCGWNLRAQRYPPMNRDLLLALKREFAPDVTLLSALLGRDLTHWNEPPPAAGNFSSCAFASAAPAAAPTFPLQLTHGESSD